MATNRQRIAYLDPRKSLAKAMNTRTKGFKIGSANSFIIKGGLV